ncbi:TetR/AcrR family transcriptional regulator [Actinomadura rudentiformis]|uniref:TetR/AcrR family transcriptional regulator n=1 Tax=Actinomadura rudentiformis TaxID=359158 RepID=A0A6H9YEV2_9ACTN|nr:TetR/AcrR family transcriptional regulator [Actinomadura rudentiformis]KAB2342334.1 TetR/AcrR family transcriptional regulator [Actinomadura rudentiformis]
MMNHPPEAAIADVMLPGSRSAREPDRGIKRGRHGLAPETVAENQRDRLVDAFVEVVAEHGYPQATISRITHAAGVTKKAFYDHFADREECFRTAYEQGTDLIVARVEEARKGAASWTEGVLAAMRTLLEMLAGQPRFARVSVVEINSAPPGVRRGRTRSLEGFRALLTAPEPGVAGVPDAVADAVVGGVYSAIYLKVDAGRAAELPELVSSLTYFVLLPLLGKEGAARELARMGRAP